MSRSRRRGNGSEPALRGCAVPLAWFHVLPVIVVLLSGCATVPLDGEKAESTYLRDNEETALAQWAAKLIRGEEAGSGFYPIADGADALAMRLALTERAQRSIDLQYFIMKGDRAGRALSKALLMAADRGVRVRLLLDDIWSSASDRKLVLLNEHPNIEVRLFNPISRAGIGWLNIVWDFSRANRRMHNKSFSVDNTVSVIGGRNIAEEYFALNERILYADFEVLAVGPVVTGISESFDDFWNHTFAVPIEQVARPLRDERLQDYRDTVGGQLLELYEETYRAAAGNEELSALLAGGLPLYRGAARVVADSPEKLATRVGAEHQRLVNDLRDLFLTAESELIFVSPYFVPRDNGVAFFREALSRGTAVVIVTNSLASTNHVAVHAGYAKFRRPLIRAGAALYEARANAGRAHRADAEGTDRMTLHTKLVIVDRRYLVVGSPNMDPRSFEINAEKAVIIDAEPLARLIAESIHDVLPETAYRVTESEPGRLQWEGVIDGRRTIATSEPQAGLWRRVNAWVLKIVPDRQL